MPRSRADLGVMLTPMRSTDGSVVQQWLRDHLRYHNRTWVEAHGLGWSEGEVDAQLLATDLVMDHWQRLVRASRSERHFVAITRLDERALGLVWCAQRTHEYLHVPVGVLNWIYVAPWARGHGVASAMVTESKAWMRARGLRSMEVAVLAENESAMRLYRRAGLAVGDVRMMGTLEDA